MHDSPEKPSIEQQTKNFSTEIKKLFTSSTLKNLFSIKRKPTSLSQLGLISLILFLVIGATALFYKNYATNQSYSEISLNVFTTNTPPPTRPSYTPPPQQYWYLQKIINDKTQTEITLCASCYGSYIIQWNEWLFFPTYENQSIQIKSYNLKTSTIETIFDVSTDDSELLEKKTGLPSEVTDMQIIENTLFFSLGGYLMPGGTYWVGLPVFSKPQKLTDSSNAHIAYWKDRYWVIEGEGDSCWRWNRYSLLNPTSKKISPIASSKVGCQEGEEYIAIDIRNRMILSYHTPIFDSDWWGDRDVGNYQYIIAVPLINPSEKEGVIAKQDMPKDITEVNYLKDSDQLLLTGTKNYVFDFATNTLTEIDQLPSIPEKEYPSFTEKSFEEGLEKLVLPAGYRSVSVIE